MFKLLFVIRTITSNGAAAALHHVEFESEFLADRAYDEAKSVDVPGLAIIKLYR